MNDVKTFISSLDNERRKSDCLTLLPILEDVSGYKPFLMGSIVGFGKYHYKYDSGREGDSMVIGFSPRKQNLVIYIMPGFDNFTGLLKDIGQHKLGKSCLYINKLADIDLAVFKELAGLSVQLMRQKYPCSKT